MVEYLRGKLSTDKTNNTKNLIMKEVLLKHEKKGAKLFSRQ
jgi:hypothetical protein